MKFATFRVIDTKTTEVIKTYQVEYADAKDLNKSFHEARQVWSEYQVEAETDGFVMSHSHTFREQFLIELERDTELQFEYMSGAYEE
jgi:hypothetical protein